MNFQCMHMIKNVGYIFLGLVCHHLCEFPTYIYFFAKLLTSFMGGHEMIIWGFGLYYFWEYTSIQENHLLWKEIRFGFENDRSFPLGRNTYYSS